MPRDLIEQVRRDRNAALIDAMVLAASAGGSLRDSEMQALIHRVIERPEFDGTDARALGDLVGASAKRLSQARRLDDILTSLRGRLPDHRNRLLAFGLAASVAMADQKATLTELGLLRSIQSSLGISEQEMSRVFDVLQTSRSLAEALGEPLERLYAETMVLVSAADGVVEERELQAMLENMAGDPVFHDVSLEAARRYVADAVQELAAEGLTARLAALAQGLSTRAQRLKAFRLAVRIAFVEGQPSPAEQRVLGLLQLTLGLGDDEVTLLTSEAPR
jgi:tellurite resistance protein